LVERGEAESLAEVEILRFAKDLNHNDFGLKSTRTFLFCCSSLALNGEL
jgi:hypothetical protein